MRTFAFVLASACALLAAPSTLSAEGNCPGRNWELIAVEPAFPADINDNGIVCARYHHGNPDDTTDNWVYFRDDF
jgi:hypothetical protein